MIALVSVVSDANDQTPATTLEEVSDKDAEEKSLGVFLVYTIYVLRS